MTSKSTLELVQVVKLFGNTVAVDHIDLKIPEGSYCCLLGPSGCGKTSTLRMIAGHEPVTSGDIIIGSNNVTDLPPAGRNTAMMFQSYALFPHLNVIDNVAFALKMRGVDKGERHAEARKLLALVDMQAYEQQRVALARALITKPQILLLDEPLSALDPFLRLRMRTELKRLQRELGITFIHVTHGQDEAMALADLVVLMNAGKIEQQGTPREIFNYPRTEFVAKFIGGHAVIRTGQSNIAIRNDRLILKSPSEGVKGPFVAGTIKEIEYQGTFVRVSIAGEEGNILVAELSDDTIDQMNFSIGDRVLVTWNADQAHALNPSQIATVPTAGAA